MQALSLISCHVSQPCIPLALYNSTTPAISPSHCTLLSTSFLSKLASLQVLSSMADRTNPRHIQIHSQASRQNGPTTSHALAIITLLPVGATLLGLAGITFIGTVIGLAVTAPLFIIFSPVIVPAVLAIGLAVAGVLASGAFGISGLSSLSWLLSLFRQTAESMPETLDIAKKRALDVANYAGQKTKEAGQTIQNKAAREDGKDSGARTHIATA